MAFYYLMESIPALPGSYILYLTLGQLSDIVIGRLGRFEFPAGAYCYCGSAHGPGGLRARLRHHSRVAGSPHWHIDWLRARAVLVGGWYATATTPGRLECHWSQALGALPGTLTPVPHFGASDCPNGCRSHLIFFPTENLTHLVQEALASTGAAPTPFQIS